MTGSMPTCARSNPSTAEIRASTSDWLASPITRQRPTIISEKNSGGPNLSAMLERGMARTTSPAVAMMPPMKEPMAAMASAGPARPWRAIS